MVHPGGKVSDIRLQYSGSTHLTLAGNGSLLDTTPSGSIKEAAPYVYKQSSKKKIAGKYILNGTELTFTIAPYQGSLLIDPTVDWGTYFGRTDYEDISKMVFGKYGEIYVTGSTGSAANIATTGAFQQSFGGGSGLAGADAFLLFANAYYAFYFFWHYAAFMETGRKNEMTGQQSPPYKDYFLARTLTGIQKVPLAEVACFRRLDPHYQLCAFDRRNLIIEQPLGEIEQELDPSDFFRANRQYIISHRICKTYKPFGRSGQLS